MAAAAIPALIGAGTSIAGLISNMRMQNWLKDFSINQLNNNRQAQETGFDMWRNIFDPARDSTLQARDHFANLLFGPEGSSAQVSNLLQQFPGLIEQYLGAGSNPWERGISGEMSSLLGQNAERRGAYTSAADNAFGIFGNQGAYDPRTSLQERLMDMVNGQGAEMGALSDLGLDLMGRRGQTAFTQGLQDRGMDAVNAGGMTDTLRAAQGVGLDVLENRGADPISQALRGRGLDLASREALLPMDQAYQIAREDAARNTEGAFKRAQRQALARRGESASVVAAGGAEGDPMSEYADAAARSVSDAGRQALMGQQGLNLQQMGQGTQMALGAGSEQNNRFLSALGLFPSLQNSATSFAGTMGGLGNSAYGNELQGMQLGSGMLNNYNNFRLGAAGQLDNSYANQLNYGLNAGRLGMDLENSYQNAGNNLFNNYLAGGRFGADLNLASMNGYNQLFNNLMGYNRDMMTGFDNNLNRMINLGGQGLGYATAGLTNQNAPPQYINTGQQWSNIGQGLSGINFGGLNRPPSMTGQQVSNIIGGPTANGNLPGGF